MLPRLYTTPWPSSQFRPLANEVLADRRHQYSPLCNKVPSALYGPLEPEPRSADQDRLIRLLMSSVKEDEKGHPTVEDHLQDVQLVERIIDQSM